MSANHDKALKIPVFHKVGQYLHRLKSSPGTDYALFKRSGKQIRKSLKSTDTALARHRRDEYRQKIARLAQTNGASKITFTELGGALAWQSGWPQAHVGVAVGHLPQGIGHLSRQRRGAQHHAPSLRRLGSEAWKRNLPPSCYKPERRLLIAVLAYAVHDGLILNNPASKDTLPTRKIASKRSFP